MSITPRSPQLRENVDRFFHGISALGYPILSRLGPFRRIEKIRDLVFDESIGEAGRLDIYRPRDATGALPTVFYVHGGAFALCSKETHQIMGYILASRGYQVVMPNYRLGPKHLFPDPFIDIAKALAWTEERGVAYGVDPSRIAIAGDSAGANLASAITIACNQPRPEAFAKELYEREIKLRCALPRYGVLDLEDMERFYRRPDRAAKMSGWVKRELRWVATSYVGYPRHVKAKEAPLASPLRLLEAPEPEGARKLPPFFIAVGTKDPLLPDSRRLAEALKAKGIPHRLEIYPGELHAFDVLVHRRHAQAKWSACFDFLEQHLVGAQAEKSAAARPELESKEVRPEPAE